MSPILNTIITPYGVIGLQLVIIRDETDFSNVEVATEEYPNALSIINYENRWLIVYNVIY